MEPISDHSALSGETRWSLTAALNLGVDHSYLVAAHDTVYLPQH